MTIIAGFRSHEGIVICGDTQETQAPTKRNVNKVRVEPENAIFRVALAGIDLSAAFCGAGNDGPFVDMLIDRAWSSAKSARTLDEACPLIEEEIKAVYREYGNIYQPGYCPSVEIIYGIKAEGESRLFMASGPVVVEKRGYESSGVGSYLANYLASRMYDYSLTLYQCVILAAYILLQAKNHVEGCGGESHIAVLRNNGQCGLIERRRIDALTGVLEYADAATGKLLLRSADLSTNDGRIDQEVSDYLLNVKLLRGTAIDSILKSDEFWNGLMTSFAKETGNTQPGQFAKDIFGFAEFTEEESK